MIRSVQVEQYIGNYMAYPTVDPSIKAKIKRGELPAILGTDTSVGDDILGFFQKLPDNLWWAFIDPERLNVDDAGRLFEKTCQKFYQPTLSVLKLGSIFNPRFRKHGINNIREMDLDSYEYIEPILYHADTATLSYLEPLFVSQRNEVSFFDKTQDIAQNITSLSNAFESQGATDDNQAQYNAVIANIYTLQQNSREKLKELSDNVDAVLAQIDQIKVKPGAKSRKSERVKALREHLLRIKKQGVVLYRELEKASVDMQELANASQYNAAQFSEKLRNIGTSLANNTNTAKQMCDELSDMSYARRERKKRVRENGKIVHEENASVETYRRLKLAIDVGFVPDVPNTLGLLNSNSIAPNQENYFIKTVIYGMENAFDEEGKFIPLGKRQPNYGTDMAEYIAKMYALGNPEDALYAIQLLKMAEGREGQQLFPADLNELVKKSLASAYGVDVNKIQDNPHASVFLKRVYDISTNRNHSPLLWGPRDTEARYYKRVKDYIFGRMYPSASGFIATPLHQKIIQHPLIKMRSRCVAYLTGGYLTDVSELGRPAKEGSILETEIGLGIKRNWWFKKKEEPTEDNPDPAGFWERAPCWLTMPWRWGQMASIPAAIILVSGGVAAPVLIIWPVAAAGTVAAANYSFQAAKSTWALPFVNKPIKFAAKWTAIAGGTVGAGFLLAPVAPAIGAWAWGLALANPAIAAGVASPFALLAGLKGYSVVKEFKNRPPPPVPFSQYRQDMHIPDDPLHVNNDEGEFLVIAPEPPAPVVIDLVSAPFSQAGETRDLEWVAELLDQLREQSQTNQGALDILADIRDYMRDAPVPPSGTGMGGGSSRDDDDADEEEELEEGIPEPNPA